MEKKEILYRIEGLIPTRTMAVGGYGFCVSLDMDSALLLLKIPRNPTERITDIAKKTLEVLFGDRLLHPPYRFIQMQDGSKRDSCLLHYCTVAGDACDLGISFADLDSNSKYRSGKKWVIYSSHNVDSPTQAYGLLSLWLQWFNTMDGLFEIEPIEEKQSEERSHPHN